MATGDVTISVAVEGGVTKSVVLDSATRVLSRAYIATLPIEASLDTDAEWQVWEVNTLGNVILNQANSQSQATATWTRNTFTAAT